MLYEDLTIHQKITLKGLFQSEDLLIQYWASLTFFGIKATINWFLTDDFSHFQKAMFASSRKYYESLK